jgi:hypothetical protein
MTNLVIPAGRPAPLNHHPGAGLLGKARRPEPLAGPGLPMFDPGGDSNAPGSLAIPKRDLRTLDHNVTA